MLFNFSKPVTTLPPMT